MTAALCSNSRNSSRTPRSILRSRSGRSGESRNLPDLTQQERTAAACSLRRSLMSKNRFWLGIAILSAGLIGIVGVVTSVQAKAADKVKVAVRAALRNDHDSDWPLHEEETIRKSFTLSSGTRMLDVDNVTGFIEVVGGQSDQVQLVVNKSIT